MLTFSLTEWKKLWDYLAKLSAGKKNVNKKKNIFLSCKHESWSWSFSEEWRSSDPTTIAEVGSPLLLIEKVILWNRRSQCGASFSDLCRKCSKWVSLSAFCPLQGLECERYKCFCSIQPSSSARASRFCLRCQGDRARLSARVCVCVYFSVREVLRSPPLCLCFTWVICQTCTFVLSPGDQKWARTSTALLIAQIGYCCS